MRRSLTFAVFATAGSDDFNHLEMRMLDRELNTPHRLVIFNGGHTWLSSELATQAVEFMIVHAMKSRLTPRDDELLDRILKKWLVAAEAMRWIALSPAAHRERVAKLRDDLFLTAIMSGTALAAKASAGAVGLVPTLAEWWAMRGLIHV